MITERELREIYSIVDDFGGDRKQLLLGRIKALLFRKEMGIKRKVANEILKL